jgi:hypothetical protein
MLLYHRLPRGDKDVREPVYKLVRFLFLKRCGTKLNLHYPTGEQQNGERWKVTQNGWALPVRTGRCKGVHLQAGPDPALHVFRRLEFHSAHP